MFFCSASSSGFASAAWLTGDIYGSRSRCLALTASVFNKGKRVGGSEGSPYDDQKERGDPGLCQRVLFILSCVQTSEEQ